MTHTQSDADVRPSPEALAEARREERVDEQLVEQMQARAIPGPWAAGERLLVCINEDARSVGLVRHAKRLADRLKAPWTALYVESARSLQLSEDARARLAETQRLVERLGGEAVNVSAKAHGIADDIVAYAQRHDCTHLIVGNSSRPRWSELLHGSVVHEILRRPGRLAVHVLAEEPVGKKAVSGLPALSKRPDRSNALSYLMALVGVALALATGKLFEHSLGIESVDLIFLTAIVGIAARYGLWPSLLAAVTASLSYNFFFLPPIHTLTITDPTNVAAFVIFAVLSVLVSNLAASGRRNAVAAQDRLRSVESLYAFSRKLAGAGTIDDVLWATAYQIASMLKLRVVLLLPEEGKITVRAGYPPEDHLEEGDLAAATWAWEKQQVAGRGADTLSGANWLFLPLRTGRAPIGLLGITRDEPGPVIRGDQRRLIDALADQGALAIERVNLVQDMESSKRNAEAERLRNALLTSISHDLKTPLAAVLGSASALRDMSGRLDEAEKRDLATTIIDEAERLNRFIANLLDMTKLESGAVLPNLGAYDVGEIIASALARADALLSGHTVKLERAPDLPMIIVDPLLLEQALFNVLHNASKYAPAGGTLTVRSAAEPGHVRIDVLDEGPGLPPDDVERIFDKFYRVRKMDRVRAGTGLGLAIARGFIEGMNGTIKAFNRSDRRGAVISMTLPAEPPSMSEPAA